MARTATSASASRIRIEDQVWEEAFATRVSARPVRPTGVARVRPASEALLRPEQEASGTAQAARRTIYIQGRGTERIRPDTPAVRRRPSSSLVIHERAGSNPDRLAMWAVVLGFLLVLVAILSSHL